MQVSNFQQPIRTQLPKAPQMDVKSDDSPPPQQPEQKDSFLRSALVAGVRVASSAAESGLYYYGGGGTMGGCVTFGAVYNGVSYAIDGAQAAKQQDLSAKRVALESLKFGALGAGAGALQGWSTFVLASAFGGGLQGALLAGATLGVGDVIGDALFSKKSSS